ncbi:hypothetical protein [Chitinophaga sp. LS1]|uniref:hypothetical protein n=1 Tax=Chitinophaga sp. LS1 TaxID=3051176 RepID=UPI002AABF924|nr:hypothetical protein [Chitinophaga sp. LS1]WPV69658.1 hypothetical protein QQL36_13215 [Chitinophaga sp. LS1]
MLAALIQAFSSSTISDGTHAAAGTNSAISSAYTSSEYEELISKDADENLATKPRAYLTYVLFDDLFNMADDNSGVKQYNTPQKSDSKFKWKNILNLRYEQGKKKVQCSI